MTNEKKKKKGEEGEALASKFMKFPIESLESIEVVLLLSRRGLSVIFEKKQNERRLFVRLT